MKKVWFILPGLCLCCNIALAQSVRIEMVPVPGGTFEMGDLTGGRGESDEQPAHTVTIEPFKLGKYEVTFDQWDRCVADGGCGGHRPDDEGWGRGKRPVINVSWDDAWNFIDWLNDKTDGNYRLPTEAEWEYAARAGTTKRYFWGNSEKNQCRYANGADLSLERRKDSDGRIFFGNGYINPKTVSCSDGYFITAPVGNYGANKFGLYDTSGNVWEWTQDCWHDNYQGAPADGRAWINGGNCSQRVGRGGSWGNDAWLLRSANRFRTDRALRSIYLGFRLAQDIE